MGQGQSQQQQNNNAEVFSCAMLMQKYGIIPGQSWGTAPQSARDAYTQLACDQALTYGGCQSTQQKYGIVPGQSWGSLTDPTIQKSWVSSNCDALMKNGINAPILNQLHQCQAWQTQYGIIPGTTWGSLTDRNIASRYGAYNCDSLLHNAAPVQTTSLVANAAPIQTTSPVANAAPVAQNQSYTCSGIASQYSIVPGKNWGTLSDPAIKQWWNANNCNCASLQQQWAGMGCPGSL